MEESTRETSREKGGRTKNRRVKVSFPALEISHSGSRCSAMKFLEMQGESCDVLRQQFMFGKGVCLCSCKIPADECKVLDIPSVVTQHVTPSQIALLSYAPLIAAISRSCSKPISDSFPRAPRSCTQMTIAMSRP